MSFSDCTNMNENFWFELNKLKTKISEDREAADISKNIEFPIRNTGNGAAAVDYRSLWTFVESSFLCFLAQL